MEEKAIEMVKQYGTQLFELINDDTVALLMTLQMNGKLNKKDIRFYIEMINKYPMI